MFKLVIEIISAAPTTITVVKQTIANVEAATTTENKIHALAQGLEAVAQIIKEAI